MSNGQVILLMLASLSFGLMAVTIQRARGRSAVASSVAAADVLAPRLDAVARWIVSSVKRSTVLVYLALLLVGHRLTAMAKRYLHAIEKRFSSLIETVHGRRPTFSPGGRHGAVSFFLEQVKAHRDEAVRQINRHR